jgi:hypothetical protein
MQRPVLFLLEPLKRIKHVAKLRDLFVSCGWEVRKISPEQKTFHPYSVLLVPDTKGINMNLSYFKGNGGRPVFYRGQDNGVEYFRLNTLDYWVKKNTPILGLGTSAFVIFAEVLQGVIVTGYEGLSFGRTDSDLLVNNENEFLSLPKAGGKVNFNLDEELVHFAESLLRKERGAEVLVL